MKRFNGNGMKDKDVWIFIIAAIAMISLIVVIIQQRQQQNKLQVFKDDKSVTEMNSTPTAPPIDETMDIYMDENIDFSMYVPKEWKKVVNAGQASFIDRNTGASIKIEVTDYEPYVNLYTESYLSANLANEGYTFVGFAWTTDTSYELKYQDVGTTTYDYAEYTFFDRNSMVRLVCCVDDKYYDANAALYGSIINSFSWTKAAPVPEGYYLSYLKGGNFEIGVPSSWSTSLDGNPLYASDPNTGASFSLLVQDYQDISGWTSIDAAQLIQGSKQNFILQNYSISGNNIKATANYVVDGVRWKENLYSFSDQFYVYFLLVDYEEGTVENDLPAILAGLFRSFNEAVPTATPTPLPDGTQPKQSNDHTGENIDQYQFAGDGQKDAGNEAGGNGENENGQ